MHYIACQCHIHVHSTTTPILDIWPNDMAALQWQRWSVIHNRLQSPVTQCSRSYFTVTTLANYLPIFDHTHWTLLYYKLHFLAGETITFFQVSLLTSRRKTSISFSEKHILPGTNWRHLNRERERGTTFSGCGQVLYCHIDSKIGCRHAKLEQHWHSLFHRRSSSR